MENGTAKVAHVLRQGTGGRIPVTILTGFLGAGKTTMLNRLVTRPDMAGVAVFINELGDIGIDHHLVERIDDALVILDSGCLCCTVQGDLIAALMRLHQQMARREIAPVQRVVIETTGLADPSPVVRALMEDRQVSARFRCDGVLTVVDAIFLGLYVGPDALSAVTLMFPAYMLLAALATLVASGMSSVLARKLGAGLGADAEAVFAGAHGLALAIAGIVIALFLPIFKISTLVSH